jgi:hypothetical protein
MKAKKSKNVKENKKVLEALAVWIKGNWGLEAKMVRRSSPDAMADMNNRRRWGPEAFYLYKQDKKLGRQLTVLVYFDGEKDYEVCAYPYELAHEIQWERKFGKNPNNRMTFDPNELKEEFRFKDITEFKKEFPRRFLAAMPSAGRDHPLANILAEIDSSPVTGPTRNAARDKKRLPEIIRAHYRAAKRHYRQ